MKLVIALLVIAKVVFGQVLDPSDCLRDELVLSVTSGAVIQSTVLDFGANYYLRVSGVYGYANGNPWMDAAYCYQGPIQGCNPAQPDTGGLDADWIWNGLRSQRPTPDVYSPDHVYYFHFLGDGQAQSFYFSEPNSWDYWDNVGALSIQIWQEGCSEPPPDNECPGGNALQFDGCSNYVVVPHTSSMDLGNQMTIECWYRRDGGSCNNVEYFLTKFTSDHACPPTGWYLRAGGGGTNIGGGLLQPPACQEIGLGCSPGSLATWRHLALSYDGSELRFYVDGQLFASRPESRPVANNTSPLWIGAQNDAYWGRVLNGALDEIRISSVARYTSNFNPQQGQLETDQYTVCLYHFDEGSGSILYDASGNENHGTLINNPQWICSDAPLPVELLSFTATPSNNHVTLNWSTGSESNVSHFEIDKDGAPLAHVTASNNASGQAYSWIDEDVTNGQTYSYTLTSVDLDGSRVVQGTVEATPREQALPTELTLAQNYPNPFNASTTIEYSLPEATSVSLKLFNLAGQQVAVLASGTHAAGRHLVSLNANDLSSGIYFYRLEASEHSIQQKMVLLK